MRITIVIACLNAESTIGRCLESIARQTHPDIEVVVADGASRDKTLVIVREYAARMGARLVWMSEPDGGIGDAWNKAVQLSTGDWLLFLGADDGLESVDTMERASIILGKAAPLRRVIYGRVAMKNSSGEMLGYLDQPWNSDSFRRMKFNLPHQAVFHHRSLFSEKGKFDVELSILSDCDFLLRELMSSEPVYVPNFTVAYMQIGGLSTSRRHTARLVFEEIRLFIRHRRGLPVELMWRLVKAIGISALSRLGGDAFALRTTNLYRKAIGGRPPLRF